MLSAINELYNNMLAGFYYIQQLQINKEIKPTDFRKGSLLESSKYFPIEIQKYIQLNLKQKIIYKIQINGKNILLNFYTTKNHKNLPDNETLYKVFIIIYVLSLYSDKKCSKKLKINIFLTPFLKELPKKASDIIGPMHVNSGYSYSGCNHSSQIEIFREEEWFKVLIHELFHNFYLDFSMMKIDKWREKMLDICKVKSDYEIFEVYCETWARILNVIIVCFMESIHKSKKEFYYKFNILIKKEQIHSLIQCNKIMKKFHIKDNPENYIEHSNVFCYYVLTAALMNNYKEFMKWCYKNNRQGMLKFDNTIKNVDSFFSLIILEYNSLGFIENLKKVDKLKKDRFLRMTIL